MPKTQDGAFIGQTAKFLKLRKLPVQRSVKEGFFHARIGQRELLLYKVNVQHGLQRKRWPPGLSFRVIRRDEFN
jgi:hypothetical protein